MAAWTWLTPALAFGLLVLAAWAGVGSVLAVLCGIGLMAAVIAAVHHAEVIAHRVGEPFGTLILAIAITVIEASLVLSMMLAGGEHTAALARDTIYAAVMIICTGVVGLCVVVGGVAHREQSFRVEGAGAGLAALIVMATLTLVLPAFTTTTPAGTYSTGQLAFVAVSSAALWAIYVFIQTVRHRDYFIALAVTTNGEAHAQPPTVRQAWASLGLLLVSLVAVVGLAKLESGAIEDAVGAIGAPPSAVGVVIALLVLLPETLAAVRNARRNRVQTSFNLALGSAMASIGLTIPAIAVASIWLDGPLVLGLGGTQIVLLAITAIVGALTVLPGRATLQEGGVHLVLFAAFVFLAVFP